MCGVVPTPPEPKLSSPGLALPIAISSLTELAGTAGLTTSTSGVLPTSATAAKSFKGSKLVTLLIMGTTASMVWLAISSIVPSAGALATISAAIICEAPGRFSTITVCPSPSMREARIRATVSLAPPGGVPTIMRIGLDGKLLCAIAAQAARVNKRPLRARKNFMFSPCSKHCEWRGRRCGRRKP